MFCGSICNEKYVSVYIYVHLFWNVYIYSRKVWKMIWYVTVLLKIICEFQDYVGFLKTWLLLFSDIQQWVKTKKPREEKSLFSSQKK